MTNGCLKIVNGTCIQCLDELRLSANGCVNPVGYTCQSCAIGFVFANGQCIPNILGCEKYDVTNSCSSCSKPFQLTSKGMC